jgi:deoxyribose-phosphate aldolase
LPNGATVKSVILMLENASPLPIKQLVVWRLMEAFEMVRLGVKRIGTSGAKKLPMGKANQNIKTFNQNQHDKRFC